jgi:hypothetical protein
MKRSRVHERPRYAVRARVGHLSDGTLDQAIEERIGALGESETDDVKAPKEFAGLESLHG